MHYNETLFGPHFVGSAPEGARVFMIVSIIVCGSLSVIGNFLVIYVMLTDEKLKKMSASAYITAIAFVDLTTSLYAMPIGIYQIQTSGPEDKDLCYLVDSIALMLFGAEMNFLIVLSADRYWAICMPMSHKVYKDAVNKKLVVFGCFSLGVFTGSMPIWWNKDIYGTIGCYPLEMFSRGHLILCSVYILATTALLSTLYFSIFKAIRDHEAKRKTLFAQQSTVSQQDKSQDKEVQIAKTMFLIVGSFMFCWMPIAINIILVVITDDPFILQDWGIFKKDAFYIFAVILTSVNSLADPLIYAFQMKDIRDAVKQLLKCSKINQILPSRKNSQTSNMTGSSEL